MTTEFVIVAGDVCEFCGGSDQSCTRSTLGGGPYCCEECEKASEGVMSIDPAACEIPADELADDELGMPEFAGEGLRLRPRPGRRT